MGEMIIFSVEGFRYGLSKEGAKSNALTLIKPAKKFVVNPVRGARWFS